MKQASIVLLLVLFFMKLVSQEAVNIRGTITDHITGVTLPGAHIVIKNKQIASITDNHGQFSLFLYEVNAEDIMVISYLGYTTFEIPISNYLQAKDTSIQLNPSTTQLQEVVIIAVPPNIMKFIGNVLDNYYRAKRKAPHIAKGYYREKSKMDGVYVMFNESIGYAVYNGLDPEYSGYSFYCENTRRSNSRKGWKDLSRKGVNGEKLSDVVASPSGSFDLFQQIENTGPLSSKNYKDYTYQFDSSYIENNEKYYSIRFTKGSVTGKLLINATQKQLMALNFESHTFAGHPIFQKVTGDVRIQFLYLEKVPFLKQISLHYNNGNLEYWNEYNLLIQRFGHFTFNTKDYYSMRWFEMVPFIEYDSKEWNALKIEPDTDFSTIKDQLGNPGITLEEQFSANSSHWWMSDYYKMAPIGVDGGGFEKQVQLARDLIKRLKRFF